MRRDVEMLWKEHNIPSFDFMMKEEVKTRDGERGMRNLVRR